MLLWLILILLIFVFLLFVFFAVVAVPINTSSATTVLLLCVRVPLLLFVRYCWWFFAIVMCADVLCRCSLKAFTGNSVPTAPIWAIDWNKSLMVRFPLEQYDLTAKWHSCLLLCTALFSANSVHSLSGWIRRWQNLMAVRRSFSQSKPSLIMQLHVSIKTKSLRLESWRKSKVSGLMRSRGGGKEVWGYFTSAACRRKSMF